MEVILRENKPRPGSMERFSDYGTAERMNINMLGEHFIAHLDHYDQRSPDDDDVMTTFHKAAGLMFLNLQLIHEVSESPAERAFFSAMQLAATFINPFALVFEARESDILETIKSRRELAKPRMMADPYAPIIVTLQASVRGQRARLDSLAWRELEGTPLVAIEVDGYKYHGTEARFCWDRQRDRRMDLLGIQTLRYSGYEVFHDTMQSGVDAFMGLAKKLLIGKKPC